MICPVCGNQIPDDSGKCPSCGQDLGFEGQTNGLDQTDVQLDKTEVQLDKTEIQLDKTEVMSGSGPASQQSLGDWQKKAAAMEALPAGLQIGNRYEVIQLLGQGGMGAVYLVEDRELDRKVALKLIRPELVANSQVMVRFKREIQLSSQITHPNVLRVYDLGESEGIKFLTMQFVEGDDLANIIKKEGNLPLDRMLDIFRQICAGLAAAHKQGVTHRDLKPQNVMIDDKGQVYLTDFGLAQSMELSGITETGAMMGTPYYMSPEQVKGEKTDARSDVFSLGVVLYELITGKVPYTGNSAYQVMIQRLQRPPKPAREENPDIPGYLSKILDKCLAIDPALRYADAGEILEDLEREMVDTSFLFELRRRNWMRPLLYSMLALIVLVGGWWIYRSLPESGGTPSVAEEEPVPVLGVLPFQNRTGDSDLDWYGEGLAQLVSDELSTSRHVQVASLSRIQSLLKEDPGPEALVASARESGIDFLLTGDLIPGSEGFTLATRVLDTQAGDQLASNRIDNLTSQTLLGSSDEVSLSVKRGLNLPLTQEVDVFAADFATQNPEAYSAYVEGLQALTDYQYEPAEDALRKALEEAPDYTMARYRLAIVLGTTGRMEEALEEIEKASSEASRLPFREASYVRAAEAWYNRRYDEAIEIYQSVIEQYPYEVEARLFLSYIYSDRGRYEEELEQLKILTELEPEMHTTWVALGDVYLNLGDFNQAVTSLLHYMELQPQNPNAHEMLGNAYRAQGEFELAVEEYRKALEMDPLFFFASYQWGVTDALRGELQAAEQRLRELVQNEEVPATQRIDSGFALAHLLRSQGRFRDSLKPLRDLQGQLAEEQVREAMGLSVLGTSLLELGEETEAERLIETAIERSPGVPTRYLLARGLLELRREDYDRVRETADQVLEGALPPEDPDRTEDKVAAYLRGLALLGEGNAEQAIEQLSQSLTLSGYEYGLYRLALARAYLAADRKQEALAAARQVTAPLDTVQPRLDFLLDRNRGLLALAQAQAALGQAQPAARQTEAFLELWSDADPGLPDLELARKLAGK